MAGDAADGMPVKAAKAPTSPLVPYPWTGFYLGGHVGYSRGSGRNTLLDPDPAASDASFGSLFGGLQAGYNYMLPSRFLLGVEGDISFPNFLDDGVVTTRPTPYSTVTEKLDFVSTLRSRSACFATSRYTLLKNRDAPSIPCSLHSRSFSGGAANSV